MAERTGLEPATPCVTGRYSNQLNYRSTYSFAFRLLIIVSQEIINKTLINVWQFPTLTWGDPTLPSALRRFTTEFGMGSGGTTALLPPDKFCTFPSKSNITFAILSLNQNFNLEQAYINHPLAQALSENNIVSLKTPSVL